MNATSVGTGGSGLPEPEIGSGIPRNPSVLPTCSQPVRRMPSTSSIESPGASSKDIQAVVEQILSLDSLELSNESKSWLRTIAQSYSEAEAEAKASNVEAEGDELRGDMEELRLGLLYFVDRLEDPLKRRPQSDAIIDIEPTE